MYDFQGMEEVAEMAFPWPVLRSSFSFSTPLFQTVHTLLITCEINFVWGLDAADTGAYNAFSAFGHRSLKRLSTLAA